MWIKRTLENKLLKTVKSRPALLLTGARQVGKSSILQKLFKDAEYITFDFLSHLESAKNDPNFFLEGRGKQVILDEIQYVQELFRELKIQIDKNRDVYGRWLLTGSQQFSLMDKISESLAGRISIIHLETLSAKELRDSKVDYINDFLWKGGYPELWSNPNIQLNDFFESYIRTYIERDLKNIIEVKNLYDFQRFIKILATRVGQLLNYKDISKDVGVSDVTVRKWIHALEMSGIVYLLPPFYANIGKRLIKSPKIYFADHGLLCFLLSISSYQEWHNHLYRGHLWENFTLMEMIKTLHLRPGSDLFFYRDQNGVEIDFIMEQKNTLLLIEAKACERIKDVKLNFDKVVPLLQKKYLLKSFVFNNINERRPLKMKNYSLLNPLLVNVPVNL